MKFRAFSFCVLLLALSLGSLAATTVFFQPSTLSLAQGEVKEVTVIINSDLPLNSIQIAGTYDPAKVSVVATKLPLVGANGVAWPVATIGAPVFAPPSNRFAYNAVLNPDVPAQYLAPGQTRLFTLRFTGIAAGVSTVSMASAFYRTGAVNPIAIAVLPTVSVTGPVARFNPFPGTPFDNAPVTPRAAGTVDQENCEFRSSAGIISAGFNSDRDNIMRDSQDPDCLNQACDVAAPTKKWTWSYYLGDTARTAPPSALGTGCCAPNQCALAGQCMNPGSIDESSGHSMVCLGHDNAVLSSATVVAVAGAVAPIDSNPSVNSWLVCTPGSRSVTVGGIVYTCANGHWTSPACRAPDPAAFAHSSFCAGDDVGVVGAPLAPALVGYDISMNRGMCTAERKCEYACQQGYRLGTNANGAPACVLDVPCTPTQNPGTNPKQCKVGSPTVLQYCANVNNLVQWVDSPCSAGQTCHAADAQHTLAYCTLDVDADGVDDSIDNCRMIANPNQANARLGTPQNNGYGDACQANAACTMVNGAASGFVWSYDSRENPGINPLIGCCAAGSCADRRGLCFTFNPGNPQTINGFCKPGGNWEICDINTHGLVSSTNPDYRCLSKQIAVPGQIVPAVPDPVWVRCMPSNFISFAGSKLATPGNAAFVGDTEAGGVVCDANGDWHPSPCTGIIPNSKVCTGDDVGVVDQTPKLLVASCDALPQAKCQYVCLRGYMKSGGSCVPDLDNDAIADPVDNCPSVYNPDQNAASCVEGNACISKIDVDKYLNVPSVALPIPPNSAAVWTYTNSRDNVASKVVACCNGYFNPNPVSNDCALPNGYCMRENEVSREKLCGDNHIMEVCDAQHDGVISKSNPLVRCKFTKQVDACRAGERLAGDMCINDITRTAHAADFWVPQWQVCNEANVADYNDGSSCQASGAWQREECTLAKDGQVGLMDHTLRCKHDWMGSPAWIQCNTANLQIFNTLKDQYNINIRNLVPSQGFNDGSSCSAAGDWILEPCGPSNHADVHTLNRKLRCRAGFAPEGQVVAHPVWVQCNTANLVLFNDNPSCDASGFWQSAEIEANHDCNLDRTCTPGDPCSLDSDCADGACSNGICEPIQDADNDGVPDVFDQCPDTSPDEINIVNGVGCVAGDSEGTVDDFIELVRAILNDDSNDHKIQSIAELFRTHLDVLAVN